MKCGKSTGAEFFQINTRELCRFSIFTSWPIGLAVREDRGQVRAMRQWARDLDRDNLLWREFCRPIEVETASKEDLAIQLTEGWILGCSPTITNQ